MNRGQGDLFLRIVTLVLAAGQSVTTVACFYLGTSFEEATQGNGSGSPLIEPAGYAFVIWALIYGASIIFGIYQLPARQPEDPVLERIRPWMASAFLGTNVWLILARLGPLWGTPICIVWMAMSLIPAFLMVTQKNPATAAEKWYQVMPVAVFTGWVVIATFANLASVLKDNRLLGFVHHELAWSVAMIISAGMITCMLVFRSRGNLWFGATVIWALAAIAAANIGLRSTPPVAILAGCAILAVVLTLLRSRKAMERV
jgi:hypothetical protein